MYIRPAEIKDAEKIAALHADAWQEAYSDIMPAEILQTLGSYENRLALLQSNIHEENRHFILMKENNIIGFYTLAKACGDKPYGTELAAIYLAPQWQRHGYGTFCMKNIMRQADSSVENPLYMWVLQQNAPAQHFFEKFGFVPEGSMRPIAAEGNMMECLYVKKPMTEISAISIAHKFLQEHIQKGAWVIDATAGNGHDTAFLCKLVGNSGQVLALDIQESAISATNALLRQKGFSSFAKAVLDSHENIGTYAKAESLDGVVFNLGYLPHASHCVFTLPQSTISALTAALALLRHGGVVSVCCYSGGLQGNKEKEQVLQFCAALSDTAYTVLCTSFVNRQNYPLTICIIKK